MSESPIFVVGPSRSGTTLMREILHNHEDVWIGPETHYFDDLRARFRGREAGPLTPEAARVCEDYFLALVDRPYGRGGDPERATKLDRETLRVKAQELGGGPDAYFTAYCELLTQRSGKRRWGEKTPRHVFRIDQILAAWPAAKIVCMARDPRAVVSSYREWKRAGPGGWSPKGERDAAWQADERRARRSYNAFVISLLWRAAMRASLDAREAHGDERVRIQRYEDLVRHPETELRDLAAWVELPFADALLDVAIRNSSFEVERTQGISTEPLERWRERLPSSEAQIVQTCCGRVMRALGYEPERLRAPPHRLIWAWATVPVAFLRVFLVNRRRLGNPVDYVLRRLRLVAR